MIEQGVRHRFRRGADINKQRRPVRDPLATRRAIRSFSAVWVALRSCQEVLTELEGSAAPP